MKRKFLHLYLEWLYQEKNGLPPKVWAFGWHKHTHNLFQDDGVYGNRRNLRDEMVEFVQWLNKNFIGKHTKEGSQITRYSNVEETAKEFLKWERCFPQAPSFNYPVKEQNWQVYPYYLKGLAKELMYSHYVEGIKDFRDSGVKVHKLIKTKGRNWKFRGGRLASSVPTQDIYILWSERGLNTIDFSNFIKGKLIRIDGRTGESTLHESKKLEVSEVPVIGKVK